MNTGWDSLYHLLIWFTVADLPCQLNQLPEDVLVEVLSKVPFRDLLTNVSATCRLMRRLAFSKDILKIVAVSEKNFLSCDELYSFLASYKQLGSLRLSRKNSCIDIRARRNHPTQIQV